MSKSVVTLLDKALLPAAVMIFGKFVGIAITIKVFNLPFSMAQITNAVFSTGAILKAEDIKTAISYSDLIMFIFVVGGMTFALIRAIYLHDSHIRPSLVSRLANMNLLSLIQGSYDIYHSASVWLIFTWVANILVIINALSGQSYNWVAIVTTIISVVATLFLLQDVYKELENIKRKPNQYQWV